MPDRPSYGRRVLVATAVAVLGLVVAALLGPRANPEGEWYAHTGIEGPTLLLEDIDVVTAEDRVRAEATAAPLADATQGVTAPITERVRARDPLQPVPLEQEEGQERDRPRPLERAVPSVAEAVADADAVQMQRAAQQSEDFVLLFSVSPRYPDGVPPAVRARQVVVRVNLYVDESGKVSHAYVDRNDGGPRFETAVLEAVRQWIYRPLLVGGRPSGFWDMIYFVFDLDRRGGAPRIRG